MDGKQIYALSLPWLSAVQDQLVAAPPGEARWPDAPASGGDPVDCAGMQLVVAALRAGHGLPPEWQADAGLRRLWQALALDTLDLPDPFQAVPPAEAEAAPMPETAP